jgi:hypothetical protein
MEAGSSIQGKIQDGERVEGLGQGAENVEV